jgi:ABC-type multidrug transport system fused ATPase/permease subunit
MSDATLRTRSRNAELLARALADPSQPPDLSWRRMAHIAWRTLPFMRPMAKHIVFILGVGFLMGVIYSFAATLATDVFSNKVLVGEKVQPVQGFLLGVDDSYVTAGEDQAADTERSADEGVAVNNRLSAAQREAIRNRLFVWFLVLGGAGMLVMTIFRYYGAWVWANVSQYLRVTMIEKIEHLSLQFHSGSRAGDAIYRLQEGGQIVNLLQQAIIAPITSAYGLLIALVFVLAFDPLLLLGIGCVALPMVWLTVVFTPRIRRRSVANRVAHSSLTSRLQETFSSLKLIKASGAEQRTLQRFDADSHSALDAALYLRFEMVVLSLLVVMIGTGMVIGLEFVMATWVIEGRETLLGGWAAAFIGFTAWNLGAFQAAQQRMEESLGTGYGFVRLWCLIQDMFIALERAFYFLDLEPEVVDPGEPVDYPSPIRDVSWQDVEFSYADKPVLHGATLSASAGNITAIVGGTGSGKSTLMSLLLRLYDADAGSICLNGVDIRALRVADVRANCAIAMQKNVLFTGTIADNIAYSVTGASREDVVRAAQIACADEFIAAMDDGYDAELGDRGSKLSTGQRQRLTIARAVIRNTPILILDEPTASLDAQTEHRVLENLAEWGRDKVVLLITHRLSTIRNANQIAFLEHGRIVERGSHDELMAHPEGRYRAFVHAETLGETQGEPA